MPQDDLKNPDFNRIRNKREDGDAPKRGPRFNIYWVWGIVAVVLLSVNIFSPFSPDAKDIDLQEYQTMLRKGDVERTVIIPNKNQVRVYLKKEAVTNTDYRDRISKGWPGTSTKDGPHFQFNIS